MGKDRQGKLRGKCTETGCECDNFEPAKSGVKCGSCRHTPVKHCLIDSGAPESSTHEGGIHPVYIPPGCALCDSCKEVYSQDELGLCPKCHPRKECAYDSCSQPAYFSGQFSQPFNYCSPGCRDNAIVESGKAKQDMEKSLAEMRHKYQVAIAQTVQAKDRQLQSETSCRLSSSTDETKGIEIMRYTDHRDIESSLTRHSEEDTAEEGSDALSEIAGGHKDLSRQLTSVVLKCQRTAKRLGITFAQDEQHRQLVVAGLDMNIVAENSQVRLLDQVVTVDGKQATLEVFEAVMKSKHTAHLEVCRCAVTMPACADIDLKKWRKVSKQHHGTIILIALPLPTPTNRDTVLNDIGLNLDEENKVLKLHAPFVAWKHGVQQDDVVLGMSVLPADEQERLPKEDWIWDEVREKICQGSGPQVVVCIVQRPIASD